jgi:hypothetical protein
MDHEAPVNTITVEPMKYNTDPAFKGIEAVKQKHKEQLTQFEAWAAQGRWGDFHHNHYDWWMFPLDEKTRSYGLAWTVYEGDIARLKQDADYIQNYMKGVRLLALSWGWDLAAQDYIANPMPEQSWHKWPVRLYKAAKSLNLFGFDTEFASLKKYATDLMKRGEDMTYNGKDLSKLFK